MNWELSHRAAPAARVLADRHYNRQTIGSAQFVPPGRCMVLVDPGSAVWVTSWPFAEYVLHAWAGAWVNSLFRREAGIDASTMIRAAVAATRWYYSDPPALGLVSFVSPAHVRPTRRRGADVFGYCYLRAGFSHVGYTGKGLWVWQLLPDRMPDPCPPRGAPLRLFDHKPIHA